MKEFWATTKLMGIAGFSILVLSATGYFLSYLNDNPFLWLILGLYIIIGVFALKLINDRNNRLANIILLIFFAPLAIPWLAIKIANPVGSVLIALFLYVVLSGIAPYSISYGMIFFNVGQLNELAHTLIKISGTTCCAILFFRPISKLVSIILRHYSSEKIKNSYVPKVTRYLITIGNIRMVIYAIYVLFLMKYSIQLVTLENTGEHLKHDKILLQSFLIFLALDRVLIYSSKVKFKASSLLRRLLVSIRSGVRN